MSDRLDVISLHIKGKTSRQIARALGMRVVEVEQITNPPTGQVGPTMSRSEQRERMEYIRQAFDEGATVASLALSTGLTYGRVWQIAHNYQDNPSRKETNGRSGSQKSRNEQIVEAYHSGVTQAELAVIYGVTPARISQICKEMTTKTGKDT